jgi:TRAP-type C4-dicarboxylate transport system permease small subunit
MERSKKMKVINTLSRWSGYIATGVLGLMMLLTVADVFMRYFFNAPITGTTEITELMLVIVIFPALAWCALTQRHVRVDLFVSRFSPLVQAVIDAITHLLALAIFIVITWQSFLEAMEVRSTTSLISLPYAPFYWIMSFGLVLFCLSIVVLVIEYLIKIGEEVKNES